MNSLAPPVPRDRPARFEDYQEITRLGEAHFDTESLDDWRRLWTDNPLWRRIGENWPIGWVLQAGTEIVGSLTNVPTLYKFQGQDLICGTARRWAVRSDYRRYALRLLWKYFNQPAVDLFINTTVGGAAAPIFERLSSRIPLGEWDTGSYWIIGYTGLVREMTRSLRVPFSKLLVYPVSGALWLKDLLSRRRLPEFPRGFLIESADHFDSRFDRFWDELVRQNPDKLLAERNSQALSWHFGSPMRRGRLWILTASRNNQLRAYCVLSRKGNNDWWVQLIDYQTLESDADLLPGLLQAALQRAAKEDVLLLQNFGRGVPKMRALDDCAPYQKNSSCCRFFYRAADKDLNAKLHKPQFWDPCAYDGDASFP